MAKEGHLGRAETKFENLGMGFEKKKRHFGILRSAFLKGIGRFPSFKGHFVGKGRAKEGLGGHARLRRA